MQQQDRPPRGAGDHVVGAEIVHALRRLGGELQDGVLRQMTAQMLRDRHNVVARHHQRLAGLLAVTLAFRQHVGELLPGLGARMLAAELALAVAPAARRDRGGHALVHADCIDRDRRAEARPDHADAVALDVGVLGEEAQRIARGLHLLQANEVAARALAFAAARHVEAQRDVAELLEHLAGLEHGGGTRIAAEAMHDDPRRTPLAWLDAVRNAHGAGELAALGNKRDFGVGHSHHPDFSAPAALTTPKLNVQPKRLEPQALVCFGAAARYRGLRR